MNNIIKSYFILFSYLYYYTYSHFQLPVQCLHQSSATAPPPRDAMFIH